MTFHIESLGCAKNQVDSEELIACLEQAGLRWVPEPSEAQVVIVNTCGFITSAKQESIQTALEIKDRYPQKKVIMAGCLVQRYGPELAQSLQEIDGFVGLRSLEPLLRLLAQHGLVLHDDHDDQAGRTTTRIERTRLLCLPGSAYVKVAEGCDNRCSYCAIPLIRGRLASLTRPQILREIHGLLERGIYEIILIAQDLASYGLDRGAAELPELLREISSLKGEFWVRLLYMHPDHFPESILELMAEDPRLLPYFDLPFQHASAPVLSRMGRQGSPETYLDLIRRIRKRLPRAVLRSTFLVGFSGESEEDFQALLDFQQACELDWLGVFTYSREDGTPAYDYRQRVSLKTALERKRRVEQAQLPITQRRLDSHLGRRLEVLIEEPVKGQALYLGRAYLQAPEVDGLVLVKGTGLQPGARYRVRVERRNGIDLEAALVRS